MATARRYLAIIQDPRGYPASGAPLEAAPPDGPAPPMVHQVVLADEYERLESDVAFLARMLTLAPGHSTPSEEERLLEIAARYPRFAPNQDAEEVEPMLGSQRGPAPG